MNRNGIVTFSIILFLGVTICMATVPLGQTTDNTTQQKAMAVLDKVVDIDTTAYTVVLNKQQYPCIYSGYQQLEAFFDLFSSQSNISASFSFLDGKFHQLYLYDHPGSPVQKQVESSVLDMAKSFMDRYQSYTGDAVYSELGALLDGVSSNENVTKIAGNVQLDILARPIYQELRWKYIDENGIPVGKEIALIYVSGYLRSFADNWWLYKIEGTPKISSEEITNIALNAIEEFSCKIYADNKTITLADFKVSAIGDASLNYLYDEVDPAILYPAWHISIEFDNTHQNSVSGATIIIRADTGEVISIRAMPTNNTVLAGDITVTRTSNVIFSGLFLPTPLFIAAYLLFLLFVFISTDHFV